MAVDTFAIKLVAPDVFSEVRPFVDCNSGVAGGLHQVNLTMMAVELEDHGNVIILAPGVGTSEEGTEVLAFEQKEVTGICLFYKLLLTHVIEFPWLFAMQGFGINFAMDFSLT